MKRHLVVFGLGAAAFGLAILLFWGRQDDPASDMLDVAMRNVGHQVLLAAGDSSSRVLPIARIDDRSFLIRFESPFTFESDTLVKVIHRSLSHPVAGSIGSDYTVSVLRCLDSQIVYGYRMAENEENTLVPCKGRAQPRDCYNIRITFSAKQPYILASRVPIVGGLIVAALLFAAVYYWRKREEDCKPGASEVLLGKLIFDADKRTLKNGSGCIDMTAKEAMLLQLFARHPNEVLERGKLMKEIWEDEGVIVGRSLDMFVSRLRKKLSADPNLRILNIHGKGYKLETP